MGTTADGRSSNQKAPTPAHTSETMAEIKSAKRAVRTGARVSGSDASSGAGTAATSSVPYVAAPYIARPANGLAESGGPPNGMAADDGTLPDRLCPDRSDGGPLGPVEASISRSRLDQSSFMLIRSHQAPSNARPRVGS